jgi:hypothetical protein
METAGEMRRQLRVGLGMGRKRRQRGLGMGPSAVVRAERREVEGGHDGQRGRELAVVNARVSMVSDGVSPDSEGKVSGVWTL